MEDLPIRNFIVIEWHSKLLEENYNATANEVVEHASTAERPFDNEMQQHNYTSLEDCLANFNKTENIENEIHCGKCKSVQIHTKRLDIFRPPPILIIQLKRFRMVGQHWSKLQNLVDFPIINLDIANFTTDTTFLKQKLDIEAKYDLHGVVNHYGTLGFGHYVSFTKNPYDNKWYKYDDQTREEIKEEQIHKESAYILFYLRKDMKGKDIEAFFPNINTAMFPGRPVKTHTGLEGFVITNKDKGKDQVEVKVKD